MLKNINSHVVDLTIPLKHVQTLPHDHIQTGTTVLKSINVPHPQLDSLLLRKIVTQTQEEVSPVLTRLWSGQLSDQFLLLLSADQSHSWSCWSGSWSKPGLESGGQVPHILQCPRLDQLSMLTVDELHQLEKWFDASLVREDDQSLLKLFQQVLYCFDSREFPPAHHFITKLILHKLLASLNINSSSDNVAENVMFHENILLITLPFHLKMI